MPRIQIVICPVCKTPLSGQSGRIKARVRRHYASEHPEMKLSEGTLHQLIVSANDKGRLKLGHKGITSNQSIFAFSGGAPGAGRKR